MDANFDAELELLEAGHWTVRPHDELDVLALRESEPDDGLAGLLDE